MTTGRSDGGAARLLDGAALGLFAAHAALRLSLGGGDGSWGANLAAHLLVPLSAAVCLTARALERRLPWRLSGFEIPLAALAALSLITSFGAPYRLGALDGTAGWCAAALAVPLAIHLISIPGDWQSICPMGGRDRCVSQAGKLHSFPDTRYDDPLGGDVRLQRDLASL